MCLGPLTRLHVSAHAMLLEDLLVCHHLDADIPDTGKRTQKSTATFAFYRGLVPFRDIVRSKSKAEENSLISSQLYDPNRKPLFASVLRNLSPIDG